MNHHYRDIRDRIDVEPLWWDEQAVPRYCEFTPNATANIYARQIVLLLIECQGCRREFRVCITQSDMDRITSRRDENGHVVLRPRLSECVADLHYGDPPNVGCCGAGPTMNSIPRRVLEFWDQYDEDGHFLHEARRQSDLEVEIDCEWADA